MSSTNPAALGHYQSVGAYGAAAAEDRTELVLRMMEGAQDRIATARGHLRRGRQADKAEAIRKAVGLIDGLRASLDLERGGEIAGNLNALYDYMTRKLTEANINSKIELLDEVAGLLGEIQAAWQQVGKADAQPA